MRVMPGPIHENMYAVSDPERRWSASRGLTRSSDSTREGLAVHATRICRYCGNPIPKPSRQAWSTYARRIYCDDTCRQSDRPNVSHDYTVTDSGCWEWQGRIDRNGYGKAYDPSQPRGKRVDWAHRVSWRHHRGDIPPRMQLDHMCENTICINPDHLQLVTSAEHAAITMRRLGKDDLHTKASTLRGLNLTYDEIAQALGYARKESAHSAVKAAIEKGLVNPDDVPPVARLTDEDRADIRDLYRLGVPQTEIGAWYGVDSSQISRLCNGMRSGHSHAARAQGRAA